MVMAMIGPPSSRAACSAAFKGVTPSFRCRSTFSTTMMASSTTSPIASTSASRVSRLMEYPNASMMKKAPTSDSGMATTGTSTARGLPRNRKITTVTITSASMRVLITSRMELVMNLVPSYATFWVTPVGSCAAISGRTERTRCTTSSTLAFGATLIPMNTERWPLKATLKS
jgi:hypothetical protein